MRRVKEYVVTEDGRDKGKTFLLTEMSASRAERWANRALFIAVQNGVEIEEPFSGMAGVAVAGIQTVMRGARFAEVEPLLDEMMGCVSIRPDANNPNLNLSVLTRPLIEDDIEEVLTRWRLREAVLDLHLGFSLAAVLLKLKQDSAAKAAATSSTIPTSPTPLEQ